MMPSTITVAARAAQIITISGLESPPSAGCWGSSGAFSSSAARLRRSIRSRSYGSMTGAMSFRSNGCGRKMAPNQGRNAMKHHWLWVGLFLAGTAGVPLYKTAAQEQKVGAAPEASNMKLVGWSDLQARSAYQPTIHKQGDRFIA